MNEPTVTLVLSIDRDPRQTIVDIPRSSRDSVREIVETAMRNFGRGFLPSGYGVRFDERWLPLHLTLAQAIPDLDRREKLYLTVAKLPAGAVEESPTLAPEDLLEVPTTAPEEGIRIGPADDLFLDRPSLPLPAAPPEGETLDLEGPPSSAKLDREPAPPQAAPLRPGTRRQDRDYDLVGELDADESEDFEPVLDERPSPRVAAAKPQMGSVAAKRPAAVDRHATVRYYSQMNPQRVYPLLVVLSKKEIQQVRKRHVRQAASGPLRVDTEAPLEIEPVLPGFACHPHREIVEVTDEETVTVTFFVVPQVLGRVEGARVLLRQSGKVLTRLPLDIRVANTTFAIVLGLATLVLPFGSSLLRHFRLDFESQLQEGFVSYSGLLRWMIQGLSPEVMALGLLAGTGAAYLWLRPRRRDVFWDLTDPDPAPSPTGFVGRVLRYGLTVGLIGAAAGAVLAGGILALAGTQSGWEESLRRMLVLLWALPLGGLIGGGLLGLIGGFFVTERD